MYEADNWTNAKTGLLWTLSFLGAELKRNSFDSAIKWIDSTKFTLDFTRVGFSENSLKALKIISDSLKNTNEYFSKNAIDLGAFVSLVLGSSTHYYKITNADAEISQKLKMYANRQPVIFPVTKSLVSKHTRVLKLYTQGKYTNWLFIAEEGTGDITKNTFKVSGYELFDIMPNGQLRFAIYNSQQELITASPKNLSEAGKPAKCLWCHEQFIQPLFTKNDSTNGYISPNQFQLIVKKLMDTLSTYRNKIESDIDYSKTQDHSMVERLYLGYMEPSLLQLSNEWGISITNLKNILKHNRTHKHYEFSFFGDIYFRDSINMFAPFKPCINPFDVREDCAKEPNFMN